MWYAVTVYIYLGRGEVDRAPRGKPRTIFGTVQSFIARCRVCKDFADNILQGLLLFLDWIGAAIVILQGLERVEQLALTYRDTLVFESVIFHLAYLLNIKVKVVARTTTHKINVAAARI